MMDDLLGEFRITDPEIALRNCKLLLWMYVLGGLISVLIALASIGAKVWKASGANPIDSLRYE